MILLDLSETQLAPLLKNSLDLMKSNVPPSPTTYFADIYFIDA